MPRQTLSEYLILKLFLPRSAGRLRRNEWTLQGTPESLELLELAKGTSEERRVITLVILDWSWTHMQILRPLEEIVGLFMTRDKLSPSKALTNDPWL